MIDVDTWNPLYTFNTNKVPERIPVFVWVIWVRNLRECAPQRHATCQKALKSIPGFTKCSPLIHLKGSFTSPASKHINSFRRPIWYFKKLPDSILLKLRARHKSLGHWSHFAVFRVLSFLLFWSSFFFFFFSRVFFSIVQIGQVTYAGPVYENDEHRIFLNSE